MPDAGVAAASAAALHDVDLLALERRIEAAPGKAHCLVRAGDLPIGRLTLPVDSRGVIDPRALETAVSSAGLSRSIAHAMARHLVEGLPNGGTGLSDAIAAARAPRVRGDLPSLTIAICTRNRPQVLARAMDALASQVSGDVDLLVVENAPSEAGATAPIRERYPQARFVVEPGPGLDRARNRALAESTADIVAFADDDTVASAGWSRAIREAFAAAPEAAVVCGLIAPMDPGTPGARALDAYGAMQHGYQRRWSFADASRGSLLMSHGITSALGSGASMAVRRERALAIDGFDVALDAGTPASAGGDLEFLFRAIKTGHAVCYEPAAVLRHEHRATIAAAADQLAHWGCGLGAYLERTGAAYHEERVASRGLLAWLLASWYARRAALSLVRPDFPLSLLASDVRGLLRGGARYREGVQNAPAPAAPRAPVIRHREAVALREVDLATEGVATLEVPDAGIARVAIRIGPRRLGTIDVRPVRGVVGSARLCDAIVTSFRAVLLGVSDQEAGPALLAAVSQDQRGSPARRRAGSY